MDPEVARARAEGAAHALWAKTTDRTAATAKMRAGFLAKLSREARERLGPDATGEQVAKAADSALKAHYARMKLNSLKARRKAADERRQAMADAILAEDESPRADGAA
jgi:hypothetical protein